MNELPNDLLRGNLLSAIPSDLSAEVFETLTESNSIKIERIVSLGHSSPDSGWYDQDQHEFVLVMQGSAKLLFAQKNQAFAQKDQVLQQKEQCFELNAGDYLNIPRGQKHKVVWTDPDVETVWLAVFYD